MNSKTLIKMIQRLINIITKKNIEVDGVLGPITQGVFDEVVTADESEEYGKVNEKIEPQIIDDSSVKLKEPSYISEEKTHFKMNEFKCNDGTQVPEHLKENVYKLRDYVLEVIRKETGDIPLVIKAYRTQEYNDMLYEEKNTESMHILAGAADIYSDIGVHELGIICKRLYDEGIIGGLGLGDDCIHVDARNLIPYVNRKAIWYYDGYDSYGEWFVCTR